MKVVWENLKISLDFPLGKKFCGLSRQRQRPDNIYFTIAETHEIFETRWEYFLKQLMHIIKRRY